MRKKLSDNPYANPTVYALIKAIEASGHTVKIYTAPRILKRVFGARDVLRVTSADGNFSRSVRLAPGTSTGLRLVVLEVMFKNAMSMFRATGLRIEEVKSLSEAIGRAMTDAAANYEPKKPGGNDA